MENENRSKSFRRIKGRFSILNLKKYIKISEKIITILAYFEQLGIIDLNTYFTIHANFLNEYMEMREKFNVSLSKFYKNYLPRKKYSSWRHKFIHFLEI